MQSSQELKGNSSQAEFYVNLFCTMKGDHTPKFFNVEGICKKGSQDKDKAIITLLFQDVTALVTYIEEQNRHNKNKDNVLATVAHDLKTPLNAIYLTVQNQLLEKASHDESSQKKLLFIKTNIAFLENLILDIQDYSLVQNQKFLIQKQWFQISELRTEIKELFQQQSLDKKILFEFDQKYPDFIQRIYTDKRRLKQILINLTSNAFKYTQTGGIFIEISWRESNPYSMHFQVKDTGAGIPKVVQDSLFQQFHTFDHIKGSNTYGVGLGLYISNTLAQQLGSPHGI